MSVVALDEPPGATTYSVTPVRAVTDDEELTALRASERDRIHLFNEAALAQAHAQVAATTHQLKMVEALVRRGVAGGDGLDLNDGKVKPAADCKPYKG